MTAQTHALVNPPLIPKGRIGRFVFEAEIGQGSVGIVYLFRDPMIGRKVAIKVLNPQMPASQRQLFEKHFIQEARAAGRLNHPNIVTVYDADKSDDVLFIVMEYLEGSELRDLLSTGHQFTYKHIAELIGRIANALDYAHENGVIHRDIKPANIFITSTGTPKVLDFGIARASRQMSDPDGTLGHDQLAEKRLMGTPNYMSPEQTKSGEVDARSDIFSLGIVLYQLLCGELPFKGADVDSLLLAIAREPAIPPQEIKADVPLRLARIAAKALAKKPADRYQRASDMARDLNRFLEKERADRIIAKIQHPTQPGESDKTGKNADEKSTALPVTQNTTNKPPLRTLVIAGGMVLAAALWWQLRSPTPAPAFAPTPAQLSSASVAASTLPATPTPVVPDEPLAATAASDAAINATVESASTPAAENPKQALALSSELKTPTPATPAKVKVPKVVATTGVAKPNLTSSGFGVVVIAVSPWGEIFVDGQSKGVAPPLNSIRLPLGKHKIEIKNGDDTHAITVEVNNEKDVKVSHRF